MNSIGERRKKKRKEEEEEERERGGRVRKRSQPLLDSRAGSALHASARVEESNLLQVGEICVEVSKRSSLRYSGGFAPRSTSPRGKLPSS